MRCLVPATHIAAFALFVRATSKARKVALNLFSVAVLLAGGAAAVRGQSALDGFDPNANGPIRVVIVQPDGKILIGGAFTALSPNGGVEVTRSRIARLNADGTLDTAFDPNATGAVFAIAVQADGKILAGGDFNGANSIGGETRNFIARLDATTGAADRSTRTQTVLSMQSRCRRTARFWRAVVLRSSAERRATGSPGSMAPPVRLIRSTRTRPVVSLQSRCRRTARF